jgi:two-component system phosphate regulon response regulator PhoB
MANPVPVILIVEDEPAIAELITYNLASAGFATLVAYDGETGLDLIRSRKPDLVLLDWMLPKLSGRDVCREMRADGETRNISIIMLTARSEEVDKIAALDAGADDYITKPFSPAELGARVRAVLRRAAPRPTGQPIKAGALTIDPARRKVHHHNTELHLGPTEFRLLLLLMQNPGKLYSRDQLLELVWDKDVFVEPRTVDVHIRRLRKALGDQGEGLIRTVRSAGYSFEPVEERS